ncbi:MAG: hypothetical protein RSD95_03980 [Clostridia bacterium]
MARRADPREIVLMALYAEHLKPNGDFNRVRAKTLEMDSRPFLWGLMQLRAEDLVGGITWIPPGEMSPEKVVGLLRDNLYLAHAGIDEAEKIIDAKGITRAEKLARVAGWFAQMGMQALALAAESGLM